jgi:hypothetical protein
LVGNWGAGSFPTREISTARARQLVAHLSALASHEWPLVGGHLVRPESIPSIELVRVAVPDWLAGAEHPEDEADASETARAASD